MIEIKRKPKAAAAESPVTDRDYRAMFRAAYTFHAQHRPNLGADYWEQAIADLMEVSRQHDNRPLIVDLLAAVLKDLERDYKGVSDTCRSAAADRQTAAHERPTN